MRAIHTHKVNTCNEALHVSATDELGPGGANHAYLITGDMISPVLLAFQNGAIGEVGVNGITHEALIAVLIDRLQGFQRGPYVCRENALALTKLEETLHWLNHRTRLRVERGVEGTMAV